MRCVVLVADIANESLIGTDFLRAHRMVLDFTANKIICDGDPVIDKCQECSAQAIRVSVAEIIIVPVRTRMIKEGKTMKPLALLEPLRGKQKKDKLLMAKTVM